MPDFVISILLVCNLLTSCMDATFQYAIGAVIELEGGYVNHSSDPGGATKYGISSRSYPNVDIYNLTEAEAAEIYRRDYWEPVAAKVGDPRMRILVFDSAVNHGLSRALDWYTSYPEYNDYLSNRIRFYTTLRTWPDFGKGWMKRVAKIVEISNRVQAERQVAQVMNDHRPLLDRIISAFTGRSWNVAFRVRNLVSGSGVKLDIDAEA